MTDEYTAVGQEYTYSAENVRVTWIVIQGWPGGGCICHIIPEKEMVLTPNFPPDDGVYKLEEHPVPW